MAIRPISTSGVFFKDNIKAIDKYNRKIQLYYLPKLGEKKLVRLQEAICNATRIKTRQYEGNIEEFRARMVTHPYLLKEGGTLTLISQEDAISLKIQIFSKISDEKKINFFTNNYELLDRVEIQNQFLTQIKQEIAKNQENGLFLSILASLVEQKVHSANHIIDKIILNIYVTQLLWSGDLDLKRILAMMIQGETNLATTSLLIIACQSSLSQCWTEQSRVGQVDAVKILTTILQEDIDIPPHVKKHALNLLFNSLLSKNVHPYQKHEIVMVLREIIETKGPLFAQILDRLIICLHDSCADTNAKIHVTNILECIAATYGFTMAAEKSIPFPQVVLEKFNTFLQKSEADQEIKNLVQSILQNAIKAHPPS